MKNGKYVKVTVRAHGQDYLGNVRFFTELDNDAHFSVGTYHKWVTPSSMRRLATAINNLNMHLELDEYGVSTWNMQLLKKN